MSDSCVDAAMLLDAWRQQGVDRSDPLRFHHVESLHLRTSLHEGPARLLLERTLSGLVQAYGVEQADRSARTRPSHDHAKGEHAQVRSRIGELVDHLDQRPASRQPAEEHADAPSSQDGADMATRFPEMPALEEFRRIWSDLRARSQLQQSLEDTPTNAGPLNSSTLIHRMLTFMREVSPGYLQQFLSYADVLSCLEQMNHAAPRKTTNVAKRERAARAAR